MTLQEFLQHHGVDHREGGSHKHVRVGWIGVDCPRCGPGSGKFHAGVTLDLSRAACWRCGGWRVWDLLGQAAGIPWHEAQREITPVQPRTAPLSPAQGKGRLVYPSGLQPLRGPYRAYLRQRGFDPSAIESLWGVRAGGPAGKLAWRLWIPVHLDGRAVSWTSRAIGSDVQPRYLSASPDEEEVNHKTLLYGQDLAGHSVVVVEGPADAWAVGPGAVATMGLKWTPEQVAKLSRFAVRAVCFDHGAVARAEALADILQQFPGETHVVELETGDDPAEADPAEIEELRSRFGL